MEFKVSRILQFLVIYSFVSFINGQTTESTITTSGTTIPVVATSVVNPTTSNDATTKTLTTETLTTTTTAAQTTTPIHVSAPQNLSNIEIPFSTSELHLKWYQPGSADKFLVYVNNDSTHWSDVTLISQPSYANQSVNATVNNLPVPGGQYKISVVAQNQNVSSNHSAVETFYTFPAEPGAVSSTGQRTTNLMCFKWNQLGNYDNINISLVDNNSPNMHFNVTPSAVNNNVRQNTTVTVCVNNLSIPGGLYQFQITAQISPSNLTSAIRNYTDETIPSEPGAVSSTNRTTNSMCLEWIQFGNYDNINIVLIINNSPNMHVNVKPSAVNNNTDGQNTTVEACVNNLSIPGGLYQFQITAQISPSNLNSSIRSYTDQTDPAEPSQLDFVSRTTNSFCFNWTQSGNYDHVNFQLVNSTFNSLNASYEPNSRNDNSNLQNTPVVACLSNLPVAGGQYTVGIYVQINSHESPQLFINSSTASYTNQTEPPPPGNVQCIITTTDSIEIVIYPPNWNTTYVLNSYDCFATSSNIHFPGNSTSTTSATVGNNSYATISSLEPGVSYNISVQSVSDGINSGELNYASCHTNLSSPNVTVVQVQNSSFQVDWTQPVGYYEGFEINCLGRNGANSQKNIKQYDSYGIYGNATYQENCKDLTAGSYYYVTVISMLNDSEITTSATSNSQNVTTNPNSPVLTCGTSSSDSVNLTMTLPAGQCTEYSITNNNTNPQTVACNPTSPVNYPLSGLPSDSSIQISVKTLSIYDSNPKESAPDTCVKWTLSEKVKNLNATSSSPNSADVAWNPPINNNNIGAYVLIVLDSQSSCSQRIILNCSQNIPTSLPNDGFSCQNNLNSTATCSDPITQPVHDLLADTTYNFTVYTINLGGKSLNEFAKATTQSKPTYGWIAAVVIGVLLIIVLVFLLWRYKDRWQKLLPKKRPSSSERNESVLISPIPDETPPPAVPLRDFSEYVVNCHKDSDYLFSKQYMMLGNVSAKHTHIIPEMPQNRVKNRYVDILPFDHSRVKLMPTDINENEEDGYINANYIPGYNSVREFIAAQGPMRSTVDHFWQMIWEQNITVIVMVTNLIEKGREKCAQYWPSDNESVVYGEVQVQMKSETTNNYYVQRDFIVSFGSTVRYVTQYHFLTWPDFGVPDPEELLGFIKMIRDHVNRKVRSEKTGGGPVLIHCSAGVGRTGTFILLDHLLQVVQQDTFVDVFQIVKQMRNFRPRMVQTESQYSFAHDCLKLALEKDEQNKYNGDAVYVNHAMEPVYENTSTFVV